MLALKTCKDKISKEEFSKIFEVLILNEKLKEISVIFPEIQGVFVDEKNREIVLVTLKSEDDFIKLQQAKSILNAPVRLMVLSAPFLEH